MHFAPKDTLQKDMDPPSR